MRDALRDLLLLNDIRSGWFCTKQVLALGVAFLLEVVIETYANFVKNALTFIHDR